MANIAITGVTGKTGMYFLEFLIKDKKYCKQNEFAFITGSKKKADKLQNLPMTKIIAVGDVTDKEFLDSFFKEKHYDTLLHIAGTRLTPLLSRAAVEHGVKRLILVHTTGIYSKYKRAAQVYVEKEAELRKFIKGKGVTLTILRPTMIYGNLEDKNVSQFIRMVDKLRIFPVVNGARYELQPVHARDLGKAYYSVLLQPDVTANKEYTLSGGEPIMLIDMLKVMGRYLKVKNVFVSIPFWFAYLGACVFYGVSFGKMDYREKVQRLCEPRTFSYEKAAEDFGYSPMPFPEGVKEEIEMYLQQKKTARSWS